MLRDGTCLFSRPLPTAETITKAPGAAQRPSLHHGGDDNQRRLVLCAATDSGTPKWVLLSITGHLRSCARISATNKIACQRYAPVAKMHDLQLCHPSSPLRSFFPALVAN